MDIQLIHLDHEYHVLGKGTTKNIGHNNLTIHDSLKDHLENIDQATKSTYSSHTCIPNNKYCSLK